MQMDAQFLFKCEPLVASLSGAWALVRARVNTLKATQEEIKNHVDEVNRELDEAENNVAVLRQQIKYYLIFLIQIILLLNIKKKVKFTNKLKNYKKKLQICNTCTMIAILL